MNAMTKAWGVVLLACMAGVVQAQDVFPSRAVRIVVPFPPGGGVDTLGRVVGQKLGALLGQPAVVENRAGATGIIGTEHVARAAPDGYTIGIGTPGPMTIAGASGRKLGYDPLKDFAPITMGVHLTPVLVVSPNSPARTVAELIALAKSKPGGLTYASGGVGNSQHLAGELFRQMAGIEATHVPYQGTAPSLTAIMAGQADFFFSDPSGTPLVQSGKVRALAVATAKRSPVHPTLPTVSESGVPGYVYVNWYGFVAPARTPRAVVERLHKDLVATLALPEVRDKLAGLGMDVATSTPEEFATFMREDQERWGRTIKAANLKLE
jgi:tripartite-type tricarboxylate transporter receptor subunit TctC